MDSLNRRETIVQAGTTVLTTLRRARRAILDTTTHIRFRATGTMTNAHVADPAAVVLRDAYTYAQYTGEWLIDGMTDGDPATMLQRVTELSYALSEKHNLDDQVPMMRHGSFMASGPSTHLGVLQGHPADMIVDLMAGNPAWFGGRAIDPSKGDIVVAAPMSFGWLLGSVFAAAHRRSPYARDAKVTFVGVATHDQDYGPMPKLPTAVYPEAVEGNVLYVMDDLAGQTLQLTKQLVRQKFPHIIPGFTA
jgi:hypothetical protein